jgi:heme/copper-type cytochrome/quinol oxidase subunit 4
VAFLDFLKDREKVMKLAWIGFVASIVFIAIGFLMIMAEIFG